jgi:hypothetical protein
MAALRLALMRSRKRASSPETGLSRRSNWKQTGCQILLRPKFYGFGYIMVLLSAKGHITPTILLTKLYVIESLFLPTRREDSLLGSDSS